MTESELRDWFLSNINAEYHDLADEFVKQLQTAFYTEAPAAATSSLYDDAYCDKLGRAELVVGPFYVKAENIVLQIIADFFSGAFISYAQAGGYTLISVLTSVIPFAVALGKNIIRLEKAERELCLFLTRSYYTYSDRLYEFFELLPRDETGFVLDDALRQYCAELQAAEPSSNLDVLYKKARKSAELLQELDILVKIPTAVGGRFRIAF